MSGDPPTVRLFLVCYQNPLTLDWYWLTFARTRMSAEAHIKQIWGVNSPIKTAVWEGVGERFSPTFLGGPW